MAATRMGLAGLALSRSWGKARQQDRVARLPAHVARLHHGREARPPRPGGLFPRRPDPRAVASSIAALGGPHGRLTPSFADAAFHFRSALLHPFHSAVRKHRRQARPRRREHSPFRSGYVRERDCACAEPGWPHCRPQSLSAHRFEPPCRSAWPRALSPARPAETPRRHEPDGRTARPPRPFGLFPRRSAPRACPAQHRGADRPPLGPDSRL